MLIPSRFNVRAGDGARGALYANTRSGSVVSVDAQLDRLLQGEDIGVPTPEGLIDAGFLVDEDRDEVGEVVADYHVARTEDVIALTIAPTVACNLRCDYCFETEHPHRFADDSDLDAIVAYVKRRLASGNPTRFDVTWFGGEPLLHMAAIERLSKIFIGLASFNSVPYAATIVTNGTRLTPARAQRLRSLRVLRAQITLDGAQRTHDELRIDRRGRGSYDRVLRGIEAAAGHLEIDLRVHADRRTARSIPSLIDDLAARGLRQVALHFARIEPPGVFSEAGPVDRRYLTGREFAELEISWLRRADELGFAVVQPVVTEHGPTPCMAINPNHVTFEPGSRVARCYADVADDTHTTGTLRPDGTIDFHDSDAAWLAYLPFDLGCASCTFLPLCMGGCPKARVDGALSGPPTDELVDFKERYVCNARKFNLPALLQSGLVQ